MAILHDIIKTVFDGSNNAINVQEKCSSALVSGASIYATVKTSAGFLRSITVGSISSPSISICDVSVATLNSTMLTFSPGVPVGTYTFNQSFNNGLTFVVSPGAATWLTVSYR